MKNYHQQGVKIHLNAFYTIVSSHHNKEMKILKLTQFSEPAQIISAFALVVSLIYVGANQAKYKSYSGFNAAVNC